MAQSQISGTLRSEAGRGRVWSLLSKESFGSRRALGRWVCEEFSFVDPLGRLQVAGCMKALAALAAEEPGLALPPPLMPAVDNTPRQLESAVPDPVEVPDHPSGIRGLELVVVRTGAEREVWNTLMAREHPHGVTTFAGCQVRYLVGSAHGWLGGAGFSAAARRVSARDRWMAWSDGRLRSMP